jgi:outer membrane protein assembly factor BamB
MTRAQPLPLTVAGVALIALAIFVSVPTQPRITPRLPGADGRPEGTTGGASGGNPVLRGSVVPGVGKPADLAGTWSRFRGDQLSAVATHSGNLARTWSEAGPKKLWSLDVGEGYAGAAIWRGRAFVMDYDREKKHEALRCISLADGQEIWRYSFPNQVKRDHGVTRTVPTIVSNLVVAIGPKCHVLAVDAETGALKWSVDMVKEFGATIPPWYTGQCPLVDGDQVILAPGGPETLMCAVELSAGKVLWRTPNPRGWKMTHSSVMPMEFNGQRMFVYCANGGVVGAAAKDGKMLWDTTDWKISLATVPCPIDLGGGRLFLTGGYNAGSMFLQLKQDRDAIKPDVVSRLKAEVFGTTQHAPIVHRDHLFGTRADGRFVCLTREGRVAWTSEPGSNFGLGSFTMVNDLIFALNDSGTLHLIEADPAAYKPIAKAKVLDGPEAWGPMAFADGRLIVRDLNKMACLDITAH